LRIASVERIHRYDEKKIITYYVLPEIMFKKLYELL
jgi:hypothetical protein